MQDDALDLLARAGVKASDEMIKSRRLAIEDETGAYRFVLRPGSDTSVDVRARLFLRENVTKLGLAPLTSYDAVLMRSDPPVDEDYLYATHLLSLVEARPRH